MDGPFSAVLQPIFAIQYFLKALAEIYKIHSILQISDRKISARYSFAEVCKILFKNSKKLQKLQNLQKKLMQILQNMQKMQIILQNLQNYILYFSGKIIFAFILIFIFGSRSASSSRPVNMEGAGMSGPHRLRRCHFHKF